MRLLRAFKVCLQLHGRRCASLLLVLDILLVLLLMVPSFRDILLIRILPLPMRGVPTWDLVRTYLCSSATVPANMTAEGPACDILKNATLKGREDPALRPPDSRESLDSWRFALQARRDKKLRKLDHEKFMPVLTAGEKRDLLLTYQVRCKEGGRSWTQVSLLTREWSRVDMMKHKKLVSVVLHTVYRGI